MTSKELAKPVSDDVLAQLEEGYAQETSNSTAIKLPRLTLISKDKVEETGTGKNKKITVVTAAGEFVTEVETDEVDENGKKVFAKTEVGTEIEGIIFFKRYQLKFFDGEKFTSSPIYDSREEVLPLWKDKVEVNRGTPDELQALPEYQGVTAKGKPTTKLEENRVLYVWVDGVVYEMNLRGGSKYALQAYEKLVGSPTAYLTQFSSEPMVNGSNHYNQMTFKAVRKVNNGEAQEIIDLKTSTLEAVKASKAGFIKSDEQKAADEDFKQIGGK